MKLGFIGMGNMASSIAAGVIKSGYMEAGDICAYDPCPVKLDEMAAEYGIEKAKTAEDVAARCDMLLLAVKPYVLEAAVKELGAALSGKAVVSIALGWNFETLSALLPEGTRVQAVMPNTPMLVGEGVCLMEETSSLNEAERGFVSGLFSSLGIVKTLPSRLMGAGTALSGCGPAYVYLFLEALADAAVYHGIARSDAYDLAAQTVLGASKMVLETGEHPGKLKDNVCSPGGTTIRGVAALERRGFRAAVMEAVHDAANI